MTQLANLDKYQVIQLNRVKIPASLIVILSKTLLVCTGIWLLLSFSLAAWYFWAQFIIGWIVFLAAAWWGAVVYRDRIELKAKGLSIISRNYERLVPWDWLKTVEIRYRGWNIFPNYVCFVFKDRGDSLILLDDVLKDMDVTTLIECVRTWAPAAAIKGDVWLAKSESIATYTELWLKDLSTHDRRLQIEQTHVTGTVLNGEYKIVRSLSSGGQGTAYLATTEATELIEVPPEVVLKEFILPENDRASRKVKDSLLREAALLRRINHPLITRFYDCFIEDLRGYLVIEYSPGLTLKDLVLKNGLPSESLVKNISIQLCDALGYLHSLTPPIIHGDVAPDNVILQPDGTIKLLDFAAARELGRNRTSTVIGKHSYMSPEQFKGMPDSRSDLYSLGGTIYFLLTGTEPEPLTELHPRNLTPSVSVSMDKIVFSATQFDATNRTPDVGTMKSLLEEV
jgi:tRNA A-37 threonylcarbamoyl transferase component Bud32